MKSFLKMINRNKKGTAFTELVIVIPFIVLLIGTIFEVSRIYYLQNTLEYSAREAARIGASIKESVDANFMSKTTISRAAIENLIKNSVRVMGVIEEPDQFAIKYLNSAGNEVQGVQDLPFDRQNNPGSIDFIQVEITYPGIGANVSTPIPAVFNPGNVFQSNITLMAKAIFQIEGRLERWRSIIKGKK